MTELVDKTKLTPATIKQYIEDLNHCFSDQLTISIKQQVISCQYPQALKDNYLHDLYAESKILQLLKFLILNAQAQKPLTYFAEKTFISNASAYRLPEAISPYIKKVGLDLVKNSIVGDEHRIRYLIAFLQSKYGLDIYPLTDDDLTLIKAYVQETASHLEFSHLLVDSFLFYDILLSLAWKRHDYKLSLPKSPIFQQLKALFVYDKLKHSLTDILSPLTGQSYDANELDYFFLVYITSKNTFASQEWTEQDTDLCCSIFEQNDNFQRLLLPIKDTFDIPDANLRDLTKILISFSRHFICQMQFFIPEKNDFLDGYYNGNQQLLKRVLKITKKWRRQISTDTFINYHHLYLFCNYLELFLKASQPKLEVILLWTDLISSRLLSQYLPDHFSQNAVHFTSYHLLGDDIYDIKNAKADLIITNNRLIPFIREELAADTPIMEFSYNNIQEKTQQLQGLINQFKEKHYQNYLTDKLQFKKLSPKKG